VVESFLDHSRKANEQAIAFAAVGRSVHDGQSFWFKIGQRPQHAFGLAGVRHVAGQRPLLQLLHRFARRPNQVGRGDRLEIAEVMKEIGAEKRLARLLEQHTRIPSMRDVRRAIEPVAILASSQDVLRRHAARRADGEIVHAHELANESANWLGLGRKLKPIIERADFVGLEVAPGDVAELCRVHDLCDRLAQRREHALKAGVEKERFFVAHEEVIELHVKVRNVNGQPKQVRGNFVNRGSTHL